MTVIVSVMPPAQATDRRRRETELKLRDKRQASGGSGTLEAQEQKKEDTSNQKMIQDSMDEGCSSVFTGGITQKEFSMTTHFFSQNPTIEFFNLQLNITSCVDNGRKVTCASGVSTLKIIINKPPCSKKRYIMIARPFLAIII